MGVLRVESVKYEKKRRNYWEEWMQLCEFSAHTVIYKA